MTAQPSSPRSNGAAVRGAAKAGREGRFWRPWDSAGTSFAAVVIVAFGARLVHLAESRAIPFFDHPISDGRIYDLWAQGIVAGDWLGRDVFYQAPLYPYFLAVVQLVVGHDPWWMRFVQIAVGALGCGFACLAGRNLFSHRAGFAAGVILALYPPAIFFDGILQKSVLDGFFMSLLMWLLSTAGAASRTGRMVAAGAVLGCFALTRENALLLAPIVALWLVVNRPPAAGTRRWAPLGGLAAGMALTLLPVGVRNKVVGGEFALTTSQSGPNFYIGNHAGANGEYQPLRIGRGDPLYERIDARELAEADAGRPLSPAEVSAYWWGRAVAFVRAEPGEWLRLMGRKAALCINWYEIADAEDIYYYEKECRLIRWLGAIGHFGVLGPLAVAGMVLSWPRRRSLRLWYVVVPIWLAGTALFFVNARYRFPIVPVVALFAAHGGIEIVGRIVARRGRTLIGPVACGLAAGVACNWPIYERDAFLMQSQINAGVACLDSGRNEQAIEHFRAALAHGWMIPGGRLNLGTALRRVGQIDEAIQQLREAVAEDETNPSAHFELGTAFAQRGRWREAAAEFEQTARLDTGRRDARRNWAVACLQLQQWQQAIELLRTDVADALAAPGIEGPMVLDIEAAVELTWLLAACPDASLRDPSLAVMLAERLLRDAREPDPELLDLSAAALAADGRYREAAVQARKGLELAERQRRFELAGAISERLLRYEAGQSADYGR